jgi:hypothetical protein
LTRYTLILIDENKRHASPDAESLAVRRSKAIAPSARGCWR